MNIYLLRHGEAVPFVKWRGGDSARPLSVEGKQDILKVAKGMRASGIRPDKILTSPYVRARETAEIIGKAWGIEPTAAPVLASGAKPEDVRKVLGALTCSSVLVVGHIPDLMSVLCRLTHDARATETGIATGEMIAVQSEPVKDGWADGQILWRKGPDAW